MEQATYTGLTSQMNNLYISYRKEFIEQTDRAYITHKFNLTDRVLMNHLSCKKTIGVKLGTQGLSKFQVFDVDMKEQAREVTLEIVNLLVEYYGMDKQDIHIVYSGNKGYHVTLFYDELIQDTVLINFYNEVIEKLNLDKRKVEYRPTHNQGVKLPLSIHKKTNNFVCFCDYDIGSGQITHLSKLDSYEYILSIRPISLEYMKEFIFNDLELFSLNDSDSKEFESIMSNIIINTQSLEDINREIVDILSCNRLIYAGTRNRTTFLLSMFFRSQGYELGETIELISMILLNTYDNPDTRELIDSDTTKEYMLNEVVRITKNTYTKQYALSERKKDIEISKDEILTILHIKEKHLKQLAFSFLIHSKRYSSKKDNTFYMPYSVLQKMGNTLSRSRLSKYITELESINLIEVVSRNVIDLTQTKLHKQVIKRPNVYRVLIEDNKKSPKITLRANEVITLQEITSQLIEYDILKTLLPRRQLADFKQYYA